MIEVYGKKKTQAIEFTMGSIRIGNYLGNTIEYLEVLMENRKQHRKHSNQSRITS